MAIAANQPTAPTPGLGRRIVTFYFGVLAELRKVTWPDFPQVRDATLKIIVFVLIIALLITILDSILRLFLVRLIPSIFVSGA